jgi:hypothetical protein
MNNRPRPSIVARTAERITGHSLIPDVQDEFLERDHELVVRILRGGVDHDHSAVGKDTFNLSIHLYIDIISHYSYTIWSVYLPWSARRRTHTTPRNVDEYRRSSGIISMTSRCRAQSSSTRYLR